MKNPKSFRNHILAATFLLLSMASCVVRPAAPRPSPPPVRVEVIPRQPSPQHHWDPGHYVWKRGRYVWVRGRYRR
ncbi:hypothetical protein [Dyadobacter luticola]|uniref:YXWGXW repeat-containing protein n=1 Tax=Dyadobacter luticola TaxID=1979387 RepID=A0A5R9L3T7_9BACT|nr:hypothetical protein [Dyadobacter luticola]TLV02945.1 hypothetical protein FEN17_04855 [Dyadobacter luticola]